MGIALGMPISSFIFTAGGDFLKILKAWTEFCYKNKHKFDIPVSTEHGNLVSLVQRSKIALKSTAI